MLECRVVLQSYYDGVYSDCFIGSDVGVICQSHAGEQGSMLINVLIDE